MKKNTETLEDFVKSNIPRNILDRLWTVFAGRIHKGKLTINHHPDCYTDLKNITLGMLPYFKDLEPDDFSDDLYGDLIREQIKNKGKRGLWITIYKAELAHEMAHILYTKNEDAEYVQEQAVKILDSKGFSYPGIVRRIGMHIFNIVEDGRIEGLMVERYKGLRMPFILINSQIRFHCAIKEDVLTDNKPLRLNTLMACMLSYAKTGLLPKGTNRIINSDLYPLFNQIKSLIDKGVQAKTSKLCAQTCVEIIEAISDFLVETIDQNTPITEPNMSQYGNDNKEDGSGQSSSLRDLLSQLLESDEEKDSTASGSDDDDTKSDGDENEDRNNHDTSDSKDQGNGPANQSFSEDSQKDDFNKGTSGEETSSEANDSSSSDSNPDGDNKNKETKDKKAKSDGVSSGKNNKREDTTIERKSFNKEELKNTLEELEKVLVDNYKEVDTETVIIEKIDRSTKSSVDSTIVNEINHHYGGYYSVDYEPHQFDFHPLPGHLKHQGNNFKREVEKILHTKNARQNNLKRGQVDTSAIWKVGIRDGSIFSKNNARSKDFAFYLLIDSSGSMGSSRKIEEALTTAAILEEGLKNYSALKISDFHSSGNYISHKAIKEFNDNRTGNHAYSVGKNHCILGGNNMDGYSIRLATKELLKRKEGRKVLFVLSDGLPSNYRSNVYAKEDVKDAVTIARQKGISVVSIMFGDGDFIKDSIDAYKEMYQYNILRCTPSDLSRKITPILKNILARR